MNWESLWFSKHYHALRRLKEGMTLLLLAVGQKKIEMVMQRLVLHDDKGGSRCVFVWRSARTSCSVLKVSVYGRSCLFVGVCGKSLVFKIICQHFCYFAPVLCSLGLYKLVHTQWICCKYGKNACLFTKMSLTEKLSIVFLCYLQCSHSTCKKNIG